MKTPKLPTSPVHPDSSGKGIKDMKTLTALNNPSIHNKTKRMLRPFFVVNNRD